MHCKQWVSSRSISGTLAGRFTALNLANFCSECYTVVRRTLDDISDQVPAKVAHAAYPFENNTVNKFWEWDLVPLKNAELPKNAHISE